MVEIYNSGQASDIATDAITARNVGMNVNIVGYSWGGQTALQVANILNDLSSSNRINFLFTIDAVCLTFSCPTVPPNVSYNFNYFQNYGNLHGAGNSPLPSSSPATVYNLNLGTTGHGDIVNAVSDVVVQTITTNDPTLPMRIYGAP
jgi:pimeloyl-ACP methyl ester carboxylesterase